MSYSDKLRSPLWQRRRLEIMQRDGFRCTACGNDQITLNVHHLFYSGEPWDAPDDALETLCEPCHKTRDAVNKRLERLPSKRIIPVVQILDFAGDKTKDVGLLVKFFFMNAERESALRIFWRNFFLKEQNGGERGKV